MSTYTLRLRRFFAIALFVALVVPASASEKLYAKVQIGAETLVVKNGNDTAWTDTYITLNGSFSGYCLTVGGKWAPGETKTLQLADFRGILKKTQAFKPEYEKAKEIVIRTSGFDLGIYK